MLAALPVVVASTRAARSPVSVSWTEPGRLQELADGAHGEAGDPVHGPGALLAQHLTGLEAGHEVGPADRHPPSSGVQRRAGGPLCAQPVDQRFGADAVGETADQAVITGRRFCSTVLMPMPSEGC